jgi:hypothetical protein
VRRAPGHINPEEDGPPDWSPDPAPPVKRIEHKPQTFAECFAVRKSVNKLKILRLFFLRED